MAELYAIEAMEGIIVRLYSTTDEPIECLPYSLENRAIDVGDDVINMIQCCSAISVPPGTPFVIKIEVDRARFRLYTAYGLKFTTAIGHTHQEPGALVDVQANYIPLFPAPKSKRQIAEQIRHMLHWGPGNFRPELHPLRMPEYELNIDNNKNDELTGAYNASKGHIALFITRGKLTYGTDARQENYATDPPRGYATHDDRSMHIIRHERFLELASQNGRTVVIDLTNMEQGRFQTIKAGQQDPAIVQHAPMTPVRPVSRHTTGTSADGIERAGEAPAGDTRKRKARVMEASRTQHEGDDEEDGRGRHAWASPEHQIASQHRSGASTQGTSLMPRPERGSEQERPSRSATSGPKERAGSPNRLNADGNGDNPPLPQTTIKQEEDELKMVPESAWVATNAARRRIAAREKAEQELRDLKAQNKIAELEKELDNYRRYGSR